MNFSQQNSFCVHKAVSFPFGLHLILTYQINKAIMENLNNIEKITLLVSTSIVCLANLFVLIERTKKSEKHIVFLIVQKLSGFKNTFFVLCFVLLMSSCSGTKFLNRKYTKGVFFQNKSSLTHQKIVVENQKLVDSVSVLSNEFISMPSDSNAVVKEIIEVTCAHNKIEDTNKNYTHIIKHNSIYLDTNQLYCSSEKNLVVTKAHFDTHYSKALTKNSSHTKKSSNESFWSYLFGELGKAFLEALLVSAIIVAIAWLVYAFFAPTTLFWLLSASLLAAVAGAAILVKKIKNRKKTKVNKSDVFNKILACLGQGALIVFELAFSIILSA